MHFVYGYNRVSTKEQNLERGRKNIEDYCNKHNLNLVKVYEDKQSGKNFNRPRYIVLKEDILRAGDILIIPEFDRLGRADETKKELEYFKSKNIRVIFLDIPTTQIDLDSMQDNMAKIIFDCINDMLISFYDLMAKYEYERREKRQKEGMQALKARGEWDKYGRPRVMSKEEFAIHYQQVLDGEITTMDLQRKLKIQRDTYFRYIREYRAEHKKQK